MTGPDRSRSVDEATLRYLARAFGRRPEVRYTSLFPTNKLESLVVTLDAEYYPEDIESVSLELRAYTNGDFHVSYYETRGRPTTVSMGSTRPTTQRTGPLPSASGRGHGRHGRPELRDGSHACY